MTQKDPNAEKLDLLYKNVPSLSHTTPVPIQDISPPHTGSLELEIGFGRGSFMLDRATYDPTLGIIGIETRRKWVYWVAEHAERKGLPNMRVWCGDAKRALTMIEGARVLANVFINFPDPWWKKKHSKRVLIDNQLLKDLVRLLMPGGGIFVQTDVALRHEQYRNTLAQSPELMPAQEGDGTIQDNPFHALSLREKGCIENGLPVFRLLFRRR